ncbi:glycosyltransferase family 25 protein [Oceanospirillum linum]|uniref:Glycosyl transferase family 25 domain-containing protein n=1 Tax=Oceanospirillum linum TaxID=966 RepID=A0A1T1H848_OCELI|nr:glycosyltransferase family 25 protein [Oceanospirillum linum]OOV85900.1 hypothetical protein BTA35_0216095 [Oceanospirillum linum]SEG51684.1 glycosyl transferase, family 25 [Oleiphilus messinensis]SMP35668.1 glycosyl transferase, family 25 [Oceanospirillum linum]
MKIFVLSMLRSTDRRDAVRKLMAEHDLAFEFIDGVDGKEGSHPLLKKFKPSKFLIRHGRPSKPGEGGCYASHYLAWEKCVELDEPIVVLEDDFILRDCIHDVLAQVESLMPRYPFIRLEDNGPRLQKTVFERDGFELVKFLKIPQRTTCYAVSPRAAKAFLKSSDEFVYPVDVFLRHQNLHRVPLFGLSPRPVAPVDPTDENSEIGNRHAGKAPAWSKLTKLLFKVKNLFLNILTNIYHEIRGY